MKYFKFAALLVVLTLQACATTSGPGLQPGQASFDSPTVQDESFMYRSPPTSALRTHGLAR